MMTPQVDSNVPHSNVVRSYVSAQPLCFAAAAFAFVALLLSPAPVTAATPSAQGKDVGPTAQACDHHDKTSRAWRTCANAIALKGDDKQMFYAGYWLAKNGRYTEALRVLAKVQKADSATLTYKGFATRKLGRTSEAMGYYAEALHLDPENAVTRAYLGEALISQGRMDEAQGQLQRITEICGTTCGAHRELAAALASVTR